MDDSQARPASKTKAVNVGAQQVAIIYAKAFLGAAQSVDKSAGGKSADGKLTDGKTAALVEELTSVSQALEEFPKLESVFASALVSSDEKVKMLDRLFAARLSPTTLNFLKVVARHGRLELVRAIDQEVARLYDDLRGLVRVHLHTATPLANGLSDSLVQSLRKILKGEPQLQPSVDPKLIGGLMVQVGDTVFDGSVARQLRQVRDSMITRSIHEIQSRRDRFRHPGGN